MSGFTRAEEISRKPYNAGNVDLEAIMHRLTWLMTSATESKIHARADKKAIATCREMATRLYKMRISPEGNVKANDVRHAEAVLQRFDFLEQMLDGTLDEYDIVRTGAQAHLQTVGSKTLTVLGVADISQVHSMIGSKYTLTY